MNANEVYWLPASVWWTSPVRSLMPSRRRVQMAMLEGVEDQFGGHRVVAARQPTMRREKTSKTNAT